MPQTGGGKRSEEGAVACGDGDLSEDLPVDLVRGQLVPPAPNRWNSAIDWLHDFGGFSWIGFGASSLLVISHCPSPTPGKQLRVGPFFKQVIEPSLQLSSGAAAGGNSPSVKAVAWCHSRPSDGAVATCLGDHVFVYHPNWSRGRGPLFWRQKAVLLHSFTVEAIEWTKSGDGLISVGDCVILWKKYISSWTMSWKSQLSVPQTLVSTTWSTSGPVATAVRQPGDSPSSPEISNKVLVFFEDHESKVVKLQLCHPQSVSMIQWRPVSRKDSTASCKDVLLTCCLDGAVRLWNDIDGDLKSMKRSFHVISVIEMNHCLKGFIGKDIFVSWATEVWDMFSNSEYSVPYVAHCDWLVGVGPDFSLSFFSIHCLDDLFPLRFPRIKFWRKYKLMDSRSDDTSDLKSSLAEGGSLIIKTIFWRNSPSDPPDGCSVLQLLDDNTIKWSRFSCLVPETVETRSLTQIMKDEGFLTVDSHESRILQVVVHPCSCSMEVSVTLDSNGYLLFWSFSTTTDFAPGLEMMLDTGYQFMGKVSTGDLVNAKMHRKLTWVPSVICDNRFLLLGGEEGIDCILINLPAEGRNKISYQKLFSIPFSDLSITCSPDYVTVVPLASTLELPLTLDSFMVVAAWMKDFRVLAWKVVLQSDDGLPSTSTSGDLSCDSYVSKSSGWKYESYYGGKRYLASVDLCAMQFPDYESVTCFTSLSPDRSYICDKLAGSTSKYIHKTSSLYHIATGHSDGTIRLWRSAPLKSLDQFSDEMCSSWELVGMFSTHCKSVSLVGLSGCGTKIASVSKGASSESSDVYIWQFISLLGGGGFILEENVSINGTILALKWATLGNGHSVLAVCMSNKLCIYSQRCSFETLSEKSGKPMDRQKWVCVASSHMYSNVRDFVWGPGLHGILVHEKHLSIFGQGSAKNHGQTEVKDNETSGELSYTVCCETGTSIGKDLLTSEHKVDKLCECLHYRDGSFTHSGFHSIAQVADEGYLSLPSYHPRALLVHLFSGNWKRAYGITRHLVGCLNSSDCTSPSSIIFVPEIDLSEYFGETYSTSTQTEGFQWGHGISKGASNRRDLMQIQSHSSENFTHYNSSSSSQGAELMGFIDTLQKLIGVRTIMNIDITELLAIVDLLGEIVDPQNASVFESFDHPGRRFWVSLRFQCLHSLRKIERTAPGIDMKSDSSMIAWAFQSDSKDSLISSLLSPESSWMKMQNIGIGFWLTDATQLRLRMEKLARLQYLRRKNPRDCALLYIALNRLQVLAGLFKLSKDEKDKAMVGFLSRNFQEEKNKLAALKNAYVLLGKHQLELAVAFFLLGGDASSAVTACAKNLGDDQLALVICRLLQGYGGSLENHLISSILLPKAIEKRDFWLASMLEWSLGSWANSYKRLVVVNGDVENDGLDISSATFSDANVSEYLVMLSMKKVLRNSVGDDLSAVLSKWATSVHILAYFRSGLSLEALNCISSSSASKSKSQLRHLNGINPFSSIKFNWVDKDVACHLDYNLTVNIVMQHISKLVMEHLHWMENKQHMAKSQRHIQFAVSKFAEKYSLDPADLKNMILLSTDNHVMLSLGYHILHGNIIEENGEDEINPVDRCPGSFVLLNRLGKFMEETCVFLGRYVSSLSFTGSASVMDLQLSYDKITLYGSLPLSRIMKYLRGFRPLLKQTTGLMPGVSFLLDLLEIFVNFASAWVHRNLKLLVLLAHPVINSLKSTKSFVESRGGDILGFQITANSNVEEREIEVEHEECESDSCMVSEDEQWHLIGVSLWRKLSAFFEKELLLISENPNDAKKFSFFSPNWMTSSLGFISSSMTTNLRSFFMQKMESGLSVSTLIWLQEYIHSRKNAPSQRSNKEMSTLKLTDDVNEKSLLRMLWIVSVDPEEIQQWFSEEKVIGFLSDLQKQNVRWNDFKTNKDAVRSDVSTDEIEQRGKPILSKEGTIFQTPHEVYKRNGELLEAICFNSTDESHVALASNRKGLAFFNWKPSISPKAQDHYIWNDSDWPTGGWAGSESTPIPTFVSPGIGLGSRKGAHLGLGGATVGREMTGFGAFGVPGYAGIAASGLGWGEQTDYEEEFKDPPATVENIRSRALCSHPSKPLFLVGSSNTHVYLWEFGKDRATATYGVLPAANVPPPYALASISAVQFDLCGQRFATAALDGTVCTWQLEVGGRSNVRPTDSSLCFNKHVSAVAYVSASGSIIAAAGHSSTNKNVVIWDTLATPTASQTFLTCHEGGARSLAVFNNDIGFGPMCPLIITGGKNGDIALYDIRYINRMIWHIPTAHLGSVTKIVAIPQTSLILTGSKDGDVKLWDARRCEMLSHWPKMHEKHTFLQPSSRGFGGIARAAVTDIQVASNGFLTCGGDGSVKLVKLGA